MLKTVVCVSGGGTNLQALIDGIGQGTIRNVEIVRVISNNRNARALERAGEAGIDAVCVSPRITGTESSSTKRSCTGSRRRGRIWWCWRDFWW